MTWNSIVLVPLPECPSDVTQNGCVDVDDLLAVINAWGDCPAGVICRTDVTANCTVDVDDLLEVLDKWCSDTEGPCCESCGESFGPSSGPSLEELIKAVLDSSIPSADQDKVITVLIEKFN